jgi:hypothetical protein
MPTQVDPTTRLLDKYFAIVPTFIELFAEFLGLLFVATRYADLALAIEVVDHQRLAGAGDYNLVRPSVLRNNVARHHGLSLIGAASCLLRQQMHSRD